MLALESERGVSFLYTMAFDRLCGAFSLWDDTHKRCLSFLLPAGSCTRAVLCRLRICFSCTRIYHLDSAAEPERVPSASQWLNCRVLHVVPFLTHFSCS